MGNCQGRQSLGSEKHITIHDYAQSGDIDRFQKLLQENPSLLNERNATMLETPLHLSAANDKTKIVKFLLEWKGYNKVDLEAKNMRGETPLHLAAKNGCNEAAQLLLAHGALVEAKTKEGMTVLDHLSNIQESGKLRDVFLSHQEEQRKKKVLEAFSKQKEKMDALDKEISNIVGLDELKMQLRKWAKSILVDERRKALGLIVGTQRPPYIPFQGNPGTGRALPHPGLALPPPLLKVGTRRLPHMAFLGNPGTGKTMVARILGRLLHNVGILHTPNVKEVQRVDLVGEFIGQTGLKTREKIKEAEGGILFVDEAYRLIPPGRYGGDFGLEALEEIMSCMDSGKVLVIFAGYNEPMQHVIYSNEGFRRRVTNIFKFKDLSCEELANLLHIKMSNQVEDNLLYGFKLHSCCSENAIAELIQKETTKVQRMEMNGVLVDIMLNNAKQNLDCRITDDCVESGELLTIKLEDFEAALRFLPK